MFVYDSQSKRKETSVTINESEEERRTAAPAAAATNTPITEPATYVYQETQTLIHTLFVNRDIWLFNLSLYHFRQHTNTVSLLSVCVFVCASKCLYFC